MPAEPDLPSGHTESTLKKSTDRQVVETPIGCDAVCSKYTPEADTGLGPAVWRKMVTRAWRSRELTWRLILRDFGVRYRQSLLGPLWVVASILIPTAIFIWLNHSQVLPIAGTPLPYPLFLLVNLTIWQLFSSAVASATQSLVGASTLITKLRLPLESLVVASATHSILDFLVRVLVLCIAFPLVGYVPNARIVFVIPLLLPLVLFTLGVGLLLSLLNALVRDPGHVVNHVLSLLMFLSPVLYPIDGRHSWVLRLNPVAPFLQMAQDLSTTGRISSPESYLAASVFGVIFFLSAWRAFVATSARIAERI